MAFRRWDLIVGSEWVLVATFWGPCLVPGLLSSLFLFQAAWSEQAGSITPLPFHRSINNGISWHSIKLLKPWTRIDLPSFKLIFHWWFVSDESLVKCNFRYLHNYAYITLFSALPHAWCYSLSCVTSVLLELIITKVWQACGTGEYRGPEEPNSWGDQSPLPSWEGRIFRMETINPLVTSVIFEEQI